MLPYTTGMRSAPIIRLLAYTTAAGLLIYAGYLGFFYWRAQHTGDRVPGNSIITYTTMTPSERATPSPTMADAYKVPANQPRAIALPSINTSGFIQRVDRDNQGRMATPTNVAFAAWYVKSSLPGQPGLSIINGHVSGRYKPGIFKNIQKLQKNDAIRIQLGDLSWIEYRVTDTTIHDASDTKALFNRNSDVTSELHLVTCGGTYNKINKSYDKRVLVTAALLSS